MKVTVIGLGKMGLPIAKNLLLGGFDVIGYNRSPERRGLFTEFGGKTTDRLDDAVSGADVVVTMLSNDAAVLEVSGQMVGAMKKGAVHISMSTISPETAIALKKAGDRYNVGFLSAPVLGRPPAAETKQLFILLSGDADTKSKVEGIWPAISQRVFDLDQNPATAKTVKLMINYMIFITTGMLSEIMLIAEKTGVDKRALLDTMTSTVFGAPVIKNYGNLVIEEKENPNGFATALASKDIRLMQETAARHNLNLPFGEVIQNHFSEIIDKKNGDQDVALLIRHLRESVAMR